MAYVQPNSTIEFFSDINLSDKYTDSLYFASVSAKDTYFTNLTKIARVLTCSYTRENRGFVRVEVPMATLIGATYMRFKNTSFENKWFYAFVDKVDYVNNQTTEVKFSIDPLMTWMGTFTLNECYIERQHTLNDGIGNNIADEGLPTGEYIVEGREQPQFGNPVIVVVYLDPNAQQTASGQFIGGVYSGYSYQVFTNVAAVNQFLTDFLNQNVIDNVIAMYMSYDNIANGAQSLGTGIYQMIYNVSKPYSSLNGYVPRNNKLYCYPYKFLSVDNSEGANKEYMYEYFNTLPDATSSGDCSFYIKAVSSGSCEAFIAPRGYNGVDTSEETANFTERLGMSHFPQCAWGINSYAAYLANKNAYLEQDIVKGGVKGVLDTTNNAMKGAIMGGPAGAVITGASSAFSSVTNVFGLVAENFVENKIRPTSPSQRRGSETIDAMFQQGQKKFTISKMCITKNYAMMIDSYFDMFGYAIREHGVPNMNARPNWTFVKTIGCNVGGAIPADDASVIEAIFDNGIRFWKNHNNIGNYSLNNAPST